MSIRDSGVATVTGLSCVVFTLLTINIFAPRWAHHLGIDCYDLHKSREAIRIQTAEAARIEAERIHIIREYQSSGLIANRVIEGQITLHEATDELEPILRHRIGFECAWPEDPPPSFRHAVARYVITRVEAELGNNVQQLAAVSARLKAQYVAMK